MNGVDSLGDVCIVYLIAIYVYSMNGMGDIYRCIVKKKGSGLFI